MRLDTAVAAALGMLNVVRGSSIPQFAVRDTPTLGVDPNVTRSYKKWELKLQQAGEHACRKHGNNDDLVQYTDSGYYDSECVNLDKTKVNSSEIESLAWIANGHKLCPYNKKNCEGGIKHLLPPVIEDEKCYPFAGWESYSVAKLSEGCG